MNVDKIIMSSDENPLYIDFWPIISTVYKKMFNIPVHLAFVTEKEENDPYVLELKKYGLVTVVKPVPGFAIANQSKMARHILASEQGNLVCYIDDIDLFPLNKQFIIDKVKDRPKNHMLCVGAEFFAYGNNGVFSISQMTAEGNIFKSLFNPSSLSREQLFKSWVGMHTFNDSRRKEDFSNNTPSWDGDCFSDEYLIRALIKKEKIPTFHKPRDYDWETQSVDRAFWQRFDQKRLDNHGYVFAHCLRPYKGNEIYIQPLIDYINKNY